MTRVALVLAAALAAGSVGTASAHVSSGELFVAKLLRGEIVESRSHVPETLPDPFALTKMSGQTVEPAPVVTSPEPLLRATPQVGCRPGSRPEPDIQGRVPEGSAKNGLWCNMDLLARHGTSGGFKVLRYVDRAGRECGYYDTALIFPANVFRLDGTSAGVVVLDMSDPARPKQTDTLWEPPMLAPHESLILNEKRGLIAAIHGTIGQGLGQVSIYDASEDCRKPKLQSTTPSARWGHESGFSVDGKTLYATSQPAITAIDVSDPKAPRPIWLGNTTAHGMTLNDDGTRGYVASDWGGNMFVLDTSEIQARKENPQVREITRFAWKHNSRPQNAISFTRDGRPYLLEIDEAHAGLNGGDEHQIGAARIIDIADETRPRVIANLRLQVHQREDHIAAADDPGASNQGYAAHYCDVSSRVDPQVVACSFVMSGLRVFDISDLADPKEIAYYVAPPKAVLENNMVESPYAMSQPAIAPERREVWYTDVATGFNALRVSKSVWPQKSDRVRRACGTTTVRKRVQLPRGARVRSVRATVAGKQLAVQREGRFAVVSFTPAADRAVELRLRLRLADGRTRALSARYRRCTATT